MNRYNPPRPNLVDVGKLRVSAQTSVFERNSLRLNLWFGAILVISIIGALAYGRWKKIKEEKEIEKEQKAKLFIEQLRQQNTPVIATYGRRVYEPNPNEDSGRARDAVQEAAEYMPRIWDVNDGKRLDTLPLSDGRVYDQLYGHQIEGVIQSSDLQTTDLYRDNPYSISPQVNPLDLSLYR
jgi:hypothetical protein